jgi:hypothetical protein
MTLRSVALCLATVLTLGTAACVTNRGLVLDQPTVVEAACGECLFGMKGDDCDLAIRVQGHRYFVDGVALDSLGDAHAATGMCRVIRQARVTGRVEHGRFHAVSFELLPGTGSRP